jgi:glucose/arabinose dehydrogenase
VLPVAIFVFLVAVQVAVGFHARQLVAAAAQDALRATQEQDAGPAAGQAAGEQLLAEETSGFLASPSVTVTPGPGGTVSVTASGTVLSVVPFLAWDLTATEVGPVEVFRPGGEP